ncbi:docking protein 1b [Rhinoraja longicauda]
MDKAIKEGQLHILQPKFGKKSWKKNWFVLYPASQFGISRLEFFDSKENVSEKQTTKKMDKKLIRLSNCIRITHVPSEVCPKECMSAFAIETEEKLYTFAAEKSTSAEWVEILCETAFPPPLTDISHGTKPLEMAENSIYYSRSEVNEFWVNVQKTDAAERCNLHGTYILKADKESLLLKDTKTHEVLFNWPYKLMRRYGRDKVMFSFEAGRRCVSGAGNFTFETKHGNDVFLIVESSIQEQKAQAEENRRSLHPSEPGDGSGSADSLTADPSPPNSVGTGAGPGAKGSPGGREAPPAKKEQVGPPRGAEEKNLTKHLKSRSLPDPPDCGLPTPPRSPVPKHMATSDPSSVYSDPLDALGVGKRNSDCPYSDPLDSIPKDPAIQPPPRLGSKDRRRAEPLYADIYERVNYDFSQAAVSAPRSEEHIYDEPEGRAFQHPPEGRAPQPLPLTTNLYEQAKQQGGQDSWKEKVPCASAPLQPPPRGGEKSIAKPQKPKPRPLPAPKPTNRMLVKDKQADLKTVGKEQANPGTERPMVKNFNSSNNCIYSNVMKNKRPEKEAFVDEFTISPDSVYEDLGSL